METGPVHDVILLETGLLDDVSLLETDLYTMLIWWRKGTVHDDNLTETGPVHTN